MFCFDAVLKNLFTEKLAGVNLWEFSMWWLTSSSFFLYICIQIGEVHWVDVFELFLHSILDILLRIFHLKKKNLSGYILILLRTCQRGSPRCHFWFLLVSRGISDCSTCRGSSIMVLLPFFQRSLRIFFSPYCSKQKHHSIMDWCQESNWI